MTNWGRENTKQTFFLVNGWIQRRNYLSPVLFLILHGVVLFVRDDGDIVIKMLGLGFIEGPSLDGELMAIREHTVRIVSSDIWVGSPLLCPLLLAVIIAADFECSGSLRPPRNLVTICNWTIINFLP